MAATFSRAGFHRLFRGDGAVSEDRRNHDDLDRRIAKAQAESAPPASKREESSGYAIGMEFVGAILGGGFIGWLLDRWLGTAPWLMIVLLLLGFAAGTRNAMRRSGEFDGTPNKKDGSG